MSLVAVFSRDRRLQAQLSDALAQAHDLAEARSWSGFGRLVRERPATAAVADLESIGRDGGAVSRLLRFRSSFPGLGFVVLVRRHRDPVLLFRLGAVGIRNVVLVELESVERSLLRSVGRSLEGGVVAQVLRTISGYVPPRELGAVRMALDSVHLQWSAEEFARRVGLSRPFLSRCLKSWGLPSVGNLLLWTRLLHAGYWLPDPGRTGESVARQLEYCDGSAFRRALRSRTGATPTEVARGGGVRFVLRHFLEACTFDRDVRRRRFSVA